MDHRADEHTRQETIASYKRENWPGALYHYCSLNAFLKILETKQLWMTWAQALNDSSEGKAYEDWMHSYIRDRERSGCADPRCEMRHANGIGCDMSEWMDVYDSAFRTNDSIGREHFVASFTEEGDSIPQWAMYGDDGAGVAVEVDPGRLPLVVEFDGKAVGSPYLAKVQYWGGATDTLTTSMRENLNAMPCRVGPAERSVMLLLPFDVDGMVIKDHAFSAEREWRVVHSVPEVEWRILGPGNSRDFGQRTYLVNRAGRLTARHTLNLGDAVRGVRLGPKLRHDTPTWTLMRSLLHDAGIDPPRVDQSSATYR